LWNFKIEFFAKPSGAFFTFCLFISVFTLVSNALEAKKSKKKAVVAQTAEEAN
jgi:uncharacterized membrane protein